jgi:hypothetical protein
MNGRANAATVTRRPRQAILPSTTAAKILPVASMPSWRDTRLEQYRRRGHARGQRRAQNYAGSRRPSLSSAYAPSNRVCRNFSLFRGNRSVAGARGSMPSYAGGRGTSLFRRTRSAFLPWTRRSTCLFRRTRAMPSYSRGGGSLRARAAAWRRSCWQRGGVPAGSRGGSSRGHDALASRPTHFFLRSSCSSGPVADPGDTTARLPPPPL